MSGFFIFVVLVIFAINIFSSIAENNKPKKIRRNMKPRGQGAQSSSKAAIWQVPQVNPQQRNAQQRAQPSAQSQASQNARRANLRQAALREARRKLEDKLDDRKTRRKDPADQNPERTADWGERARFAWVKLTDFLVYGAGILLYFFLSGQGF